MIEQAKKGFHDAQAKYLAALRAQGRHAEASALEAKPAADLYGAKGSAPIEFYVIYGHVKADLTFPDRYNVHFDAWPWGVGAGGGIGYGGYYGVNHYVLTDYGSGDCHYWCQFGGDLGGGALQVTCWRPGFGALGQINVV